MTLFGNAFDDVSTYGDQRPSDAYWRRLLGGEDFIAVVALDQGQLVGGIAAYELKKFERQRSEIYLYDLAVALPYRRRGIASALIGELKRIARARSAETIIVQANTDSDDAPAIALYSKLGKREDVLQFEIPVGSDDSTV